MTRFIHDQFAKQYLKELLTPFGNVETSRDIAGEVRQLDVLFSPKAEPEIDAAVLGILGQIAAKPAVFEPFRSQSNPEKFAVVWANSLTCTPNLNASQLETIPGLQRQTCPNSGYCRRLFPTRC